MRACPVCAHGALDLVRDLKPDLPRNLPTGAHAVLELMVDGNFKLDHFAACGRQSPAIEAELSGGLVGGVLLPDPQSSHAEQMVSSQCQQARTGKAVLAPACSAASCVV